MHLHNTFLKIDPKKRNKNKAVWLVAKFGSFLLWLVASPPSLPDKIEKKKTLVPEKP
jgi:hypothetical protein